MVVLQAPKETLGPDCCNTFNYRGHLCNIFMSGALFTSSFGVQSTCFYRFVNWTVITCCIKFSSKLLTIHSVNNSTKKNRSVQCRNISSLQYTYNCQTVQTLEDRSVWCRGIFWQTVTQMEYVSMIPVWWPKNRHHDSSFEFSSPCYLPYTPWKMRWGVFIWLQSAPSGAIKSYTLVIYITISLSTFMSLQTAYDNRWHKTLMLIPNTKINPC